MFPDHGWAIRKFAPSLRAETDNFAAVKQAPSFVLTIVSRVVLEAK